MEKGYQSTKSEQKNLSEPRPLSHFVRVRAKGQVYNVRLTPALVSTPGLWLVPKTMVLPY
jgi:hypothetical protein